MKKITFILFALIAGTTFAQNQAEGTAAVNAQIVSPLEIASEGVLNFGTFTTSINDASITILADGSAKNFSETDMELPDDVFSVPTFTITKSANVQYGIDLEVSEAPTDGTNNLSLSNLTSTASSENNDVATFSVGGTLNVPSNTIEGIYTGQVKVTVTYE